MASVLNHPLYTYGRDRLKRVNDGDVRSQLHPMLSGGKLCALLDRSMLRGLYDARRLPEVAGHILETALFRALFMVIRLSIT